MGLRERHKLCFLTFLATYSCSNKQTHRKSYNQISTQHAYTHKNAGQIMRRRIPKGCDKFYANCLMECFAYLFRPFFHSSYFSGELVNGPTYFCPLANMTDQKNRKENQKWGNLDTEFVLLKLKWFAG